MSGAERLRLGHRRLSSVVARAAAGDAVDRPVDSPGDSPVELRWRDGQSVEVTRLDADRDPAAALAALAAALRTVHAEGAVYAMAWVAADDGPAIGCLLRAGFEPELVGPGHESTWKRLLEAESRPVHLL